MHYATREAATSVMVFNSRKKSINQLEIDRRDGKPACYRDADRLADTKKAYFICHGDPHLRFDAKSDLLLHMGSQRWDSRTKITLFGVRILWLLTTMLCSNNRRKYISQLPPATKWLNQISR